MKHWEKGKKDNRRLEDRDTFYQDQQKKKKLKPIEKTKYRLKGYAEDEE